jgi:hypothetical protein
MVLAGSVPPDEWSREDVEQLTDDELQSPSEMLKRRLKKIKAVLGFPKDYDQPLSANTAHDLLMMETQWVEMLRFELPKTIGKVVPSMKNVHRIKVDERNGFMLTTHRDGGLVVADIQTKEILWCLPKVSEPHLRLDPLLIVTPELRPRIRPPRIRARVLHLRPH